MRDLEREGWACKRVRKHPVYVHLRKPGVRIVLPNHPADEISAGVPRDMQKGWMVMKYAVVVENLNENYCAHVPDLPVCVTTGATLDETLDSMRGAISAYIQSCRDHGDPIPPATTRAIELDVA